ncbi:MAG: S8/S53 family peptidase [Alphaproteobacteria bacterium]|nr:S8/S53 family peptidase [Alphaproteobacteria bacterium]
MSGFAVTAVLGMALATALCGSASAAALLVKHVPAAVASHRAAQTGVVAPATHMTMQVVLPMRNKGELTELVHAVTDPSSPQYRHYLSVAQFTDRFGPTRKDYAAAMAFFNANGLKVTHTAANRYLFQVEGAAADVERVLHVKLNTYQHPTQSRSFMAPDREPTLDLGVKVQEVTGLDTYVLPYTKLKPSPDGRAARAGGSGPGGNFVGSDFRAAYYGTGTKAKLDGHGQSVGLLELGPYNPNDIALYYSTLGKTNAVPVNGISVGGATVTCSSCDDGEQMLDIVYAIDMAPAMDQVQVYVGRDPVAIENQMAVDNVSKQLSTSWGYSEHFTIEDAIYQEMAVQGQSYFTASGDFSTLQDSGPWPEEDANIIAVGGTDLVTDGAGGPWKSEPAWEDSAAGPSLDLNILIEPYQLPFINKRNLGDKIVRNVADISANGNFDMFVCDRGHCSGGWGGTSFSSPIWAGFNALMNQYAADQGKPTVGFLNPTVYRLYASDKKVFHDVVGNKSGIYPAVKGYDLVGGLGSPNGKKTIQAIVGQ